MVEREESPEGRGNLPYKGEGERETDSVTEKVSEKIMLKNEN